MTEAIACINPHGDDGMERLGAFIRDFLAILTQYTKLFGCKTTNVKGVALIPRIAPLRKNWPLSIGRSGRLQLEFVAAFLRNEWPESPEYAQIPQTGDKIFPGGIINDNFSPFNSPYHHMMQKTWSIQPRTTLHCRPPTLKSSFLDSTF